MRTPFKLHTLLYCLASQVSPNRTFCENDEIVTLCDAYKHTSTHVQLYICPFTIRFIAAKTLRFHVPNSTKPVPKYTYM